MTSLSRWGWLLVYCVWGTTGISAARDPGQSIAGVHRPLREVRCDGKTYREFTLGDEVLPGKPLLHDLFTGAAGLAPLGEQAVEVRFTTPNVLGVDVKLPIFRVSDHANLYAFARGLKDSYWAIYLVQSTDGGRTFVETAGETPGATDGNLMRYNNNGALYDNQIDPTLTIDFETCPPTYRMVAECSQVPTGHVDVCESHTQTPLNLASWTRTAPIVTGDNHSHSGSTGVMLIDSTTTPDGSWHTNRYIKWTDVQSAPHRVTTVLARNDTLSLLGQSGTIGITALDAQPLPCFGWDCNNRDAQDWKREGDEYFLSYNGANYYGCETPATGNNVWALSFSRAFGSPLGPYTNLSAPLLVAPRNDVCGLSYPYVNVIDGEIYVYYAYYQAGGPYPGANRLARSRLVFR